jgi:phage terminase Nu1 subunit (DNA packaging protein)
MEVNKAELAQILGCSIPTVGDYIIRYGDAFPVVKRGGLGQRWVFDHEAVLSFLAEQETRKLEADADRRAALRQYSLPIGHNGGPPIDGDLSMTPTALLALMKVRRMQREEAYACGRLVEASKVVAELEKVLRTWNSHQHAALRQFGRDRSMPEDLVRDLDRVLSDTQRGFVNFMQSFNADPAPAQPALFEAAE